MPEQHRRRPTRPVLERDGVAVVVDCPQHGLPRVLHWGAALGTVDEADLQALDSALQRQTPPGSLDAPWEVTVLPDEGDGWSGRPGIQLRRGNVLHHPRWRVVVVDSDVSTCTVTAVDDASDVVLTVGLGVATAGVVWVDLSLRHEGPPGAEPVEVDWLEATLPVPSTTSHLLTFDGRWTGEKRPVVTSMPAGSTCRQSRRGKPGHDAPSVFVASVGRPRARQGAVWAVHPAWSGDATYRVDRVTDSLTMIGAGELLRPGEVVLAPGGSYAAPRTAFVWSDGGLDGLSERTHTWLRSRPQHPRAPRPLTLNTWEAVYFDHDPARITALAERAAELGFERLVLDDGWFAGRRDDTTSLGDWVVDRTVWPDGLRPLADRVRELGMQFGLWFEPEMVSLDSDVARAHPDWLLHDVRHLTLPSTLSWRRQYVLDLAHPEAYDHVLSQIDTLVRDLGLDVIKWDHNRDLVDSVHDGRPGVHDHTLATYRLIAELKARHPSLEIESCASGGGRTDLGIMALCDRVWPSDSNDPIERQDIQRWTGLLLPPELVGAHVGPAVSHSSGRQTDLSFRLATTLLGSAGFETDLLSLTDAEADVVVSFGRLYKEVREVVHTGVAVHPELRDPAWRVMGSVAADASRAVLVVATVASLQDARAERLCIPGLDPTRRYRVRVRPEIGPAKHGWVTPPWFGAGATELPGRVLGAIGLQLPTLWPAQAFVLDLEATDGATTEASTTKERT